MILYRKHSRISEIPTEFLDYMGLVFEYIKDYAQDIGKIADIWTLDNQPRKILITESGQGLITDGHCPIDTIQLIPTPSNAT